MILRSVILPKIGCTETYRIPYCNALAEPYTVYCLLYCTRTPAVPREGSNCRLTIFPAVVKGQTCFRTGGSFFLFVRFIIFLFFFKKRNNPHTDKPIDRVQHTQRPAGTPQPGQHAAHTTTRNTHSRNTQHTQHSKPTAEHTSHHRRNNR
jgi:hypothetical protein